MVEGNRLMKSGDIIGYTYDTENLCPSCTMSAMTMFPQLWPEGCEAMLNHLAAAGLNPRNEIINREDENSFDSGIFPKVILYVGADSAEEQCSNCGEKLVDV